MPCPACGFSIADPATPQCPNCGRPLVTPSSPQYYGGSVVGDTPSYGGQAPAPAFGYGPYAPLGSRQDYPTNPSYPEQPAPPSAPPPWGYYAPPSAPPPPSSYAPPSVPFGYAPYGPQGYQPYAPPPPPPPRRRDSLVAIIASVLVVIALITVGGAALVLSQNRSASGTPGAQTSYSSTSAAGVATTPTVTPAVNVLFQDNFTSNTSGWSNDSHCFYASDGYHVRDGYICYAPAGEMSDIVVSANIKQVAGETNWFYGVVVRRASKGNFYALYIDSNGEWKFSKDVNDQRTDLIPYVHTSAVNTGLNASNNLSIRAQGSHFVFLINGAQVGHFDDSTFDRGWSGVEGNSEGQVEIVVTQFTLALPN